MMKLLRQAEAELLKLSSLVLTTLLARRGA
jgi:hypothetical protein